MAVQAGKAAFFGWRVVGAAFVLAAFGWGVGFYGPPVFLHAVREARGFSLALVSAAVTTHFLVGALVVANLPRLYRAIGVARITQLGALSLAFGVVGWAVATEPWQLFAATVLSGAGWVVMAAAGLNAIVSPWFERARPAALAMAYNGASVGGIVFSPLWVALIVGLGFPMAAVVVGVVMVAVVWALSELYFRPTPDSRGEAPDGDAPGSPAATVTASWVRPLPGPQLRQNWSFRTLALGMALSLFAQIGFIAHLYSLLVPALGKGTAGLLMGAATGAAILGRTAVGWLMPAGADRRIVAGLSLGVQMAGGGALVLADGQSVPLLVAGALLFGAGIGNATSLPPLIAQVEFAKEDVGRVVALIVAMAQATYAFAPAVFGLVRDMAGAGDAVAGGAAPGVFLLAMAVQATAIAVFLAGRRTA